MASGQFVLIFCFLVLLFANEDAPIDDQTLLQTQRLAAEASLQHETDWWTDVTKQLAFVHIPRTGGTAIEGLLKNVPSLRLWGVHDKEHQQGLASITAKAGDPGANAKCFLQHHPPNVNKRAFVDSDTFCVVREPVRRMISQYGFEATMFGHACDRQSLNRYFREAFTEFKENPYAKDCHLLPQSAYLYAWDASSASVDKRAGRSCTHALRFENLQHDFTALMQDYKYKVPWQEKKAGMTTPSECSRFTVESFDDDVLAMARTIYKDDFKLYDGNHDSITYGATK